MYSRIMDKHDTSLSGGNSSRINGKRNDDWFDSIKPAKPLSHLSEDVRPVERTPFVRNVAHKRSVAASCLSGTRNNRNMWSGCDTKGEFLKNFLKLMVVVGVVAVYLYFRWDFIWYFIWNFDISVIYYKYIDNIILYSCCILLCFAFRAYYRSKVRRLHDIGWNGYNIAVLPFVFVLYNVLGNMYDAGSLFHNRLDIGVVFVLLDCCLCGIIYVLFIYDYLFGFSLKRFIRGMVLWLVGLVIICIVQVPMLGPGFIGICVLLVPFVVCIIQPCIQMLIRPKGRKKKVVRDWKIVAVVFTPLVLFLLGLVSKFAQTTVLILGTIIKWGTIVSAVWCLVLLVLCLFRESKNAETQETVSKNY